MQVFVSWAGDQAKDVANDFTTWARRAFWGSHTKFFFSENDIKPGSHWRNILRKALKDASVGVFFLTRESMNSDWVLFEGGAIGKLKKAQIFCILIGVKKGEIPSPFRQYQVTTFEEKDFGRFVETLAKRAKSHGGKISTPRLRQRFDSWWPNFYNTVQKKLNKSLNGKGDWTLVSPSKTASCINGSPFELKHLFKIAIHRLDLIAQNHHFMTVENSDDLIDLLRIFLKKKKE